MNAHDASRREFTRQLTRGIAAGAALGLVPESLRAELAAGQHGADVSHDAEAIHQVVHFTVTPARVYDTLMDPRELLAVMKFGTVPNAPQPTIEAKAGGQF